MPLGRGREASMARKILVVEDDHNISDLIRMYLDKEGFEVQAVFDGGSAVEAFRSWQPDMVLLDLMLPVMDGWAVCGKIRESSRTPIIMITAKSEVFDRIQGLEMGADDYIVKPFEIAELLALVETVLRRYHKTESRIVVDDVVVDTQSRVVTKGGEPVSLTAKEYNLLILFLQNKNIALFRETIYERVWENDYMGDSRTVDLHVQRLRKKLGWQERIAAVYKVGYRLEVKE